jgi:hypothetical protein
MKATVGLSSISIAPQSRTRIRVALAIASTARAKGPYVATVMQVMGDGTYINLKVIGWGVDAWDEGPVSDKPSAVVADAPSRYWSWLPRD